MINVLTFSVMMSLAIIVLFWFLHDALPQILMDRKLEKMRKAAEESERAYKAAQEHVRLNETTIQIRIPRMPVEKPCSGRHRKVSV